MAESSERTVGFTAALARSFVRMGSVVISVEVGPELGDKPHDDGASDGIWGGVFDAWRRASYIFDRNEIPATWLVAGQLFASATPDRLAGVQEGGKGTNGASEDEHANENEHTNEDEHTKSSPSRPGLPPGEEQQPDGGPAGDRQPASQRPGEEPDAPPCVFPDPADPAWAPYDSVGDWTQSARSVPDLIEGIQRSRVGHEIGCLPFSHVDVEASSQDDAATEVRAIFDAAAELGVETDWLRSFAFSDGREGHRDVLAAYGFECYPDAESKSGGSLSAFATLLGLLARRVTGAGPPLVEPETDDHGLVTVPISLALFPFEGRASTLAHAGRGNPVVSLAKRGVDRAATGDGVFHLSVRLANLQTNADFERLAAILTYVAERRRESKLTVETMANVSRPLSNRALFGHLQAPK